MLDVPSTVLRVFDGSFSILGLGFILGLKHALDADHLIAVSTIVGEKKGFWRSSVIGAFWGLGHTAALLAVGLLVIAFHLQIPEKVALGMEFAVAIMLIALGANVLWAYARGATFHVHAHQHSGRLHVHPHFHKPAEHQVDEHTAPLDHACHSEPSPCHSERSEESGWGGAGELRPFDSAPLDYAPFGYAQGLRRGLRQDLRPLDTSQGLRPFDSAQGLRHHHSVPIGKKPFLVGMVHGMAGSAALMLLVLAVIPSRALGLLYIGIFGLGSIGGMFAMSALLGLPFSFTARHERLNAAIRTTAGAISVGFGLFLAYQLALS